MRVRHQILVEVTIAQAVAQQLCDRVAVASKLARERDDCHTLSPSRTNRGASYHNIRKLSTFLSKFHHQSFILRSLCRGAKRRSRRCILICTVKYSHQLVFSIVLAAFFLLTGVNRAFRYEKARDLFPWVRDVPRTLVQFIGIVEILGAVGLILPALTGIYSWLTPVAAVALCLLMLMAAVFHAVRREKAEAALNVLLLIMLGFVAYLRWPLMP